MSGAVLQVDLDALAQNIAAVRERVAPAQLMLVVKDDAYGLGLEAVVARAHAEGVVWYGAFDVPTGARVRAVAGDRARVFVMRTSDAGAIDLALREELDLGVGDLRYLDEIAGRARAGGFTARVHLKIDTGLHRNGVRPEEWPEALLRARRHEEAGDIAVVGVWTHISEASDADDDAARAVFDDAVRQAEQAGFSLELRHLAASAAAFAREEFRYDAVRIGAFCYGIRSAGGPSEAELGLRLVARLTAPVVAAGPDRVTLAVGWLDGLPSTLAGRMRVHSARGWHGVREIGPHRTEVDGWPGAAEGEEIVLFGQEAASPTDLAELLGTVGEEILTRVSPLVPRVHR